MEILLAPLLAYAGWLAGLSMALHAAILSTGIQSDGSKPRPFCNVIAIYLFDYLFIRLRSNYGQAGTFKSNVSISLSSIIIIIITDPD